MKVPNATNKILFTLKTFRKSNQWLTSLSDVLSDSSIRRTLIVIRLSYPTSPRFPRAKSKNVEDRDKRKSRTTTHTNSRCIHRDDSPSWNHSCSLRPAGYIYNTGSINVGPRTVWISSLSSWGPRAGPDSTPSYTACCLMSPLVAELSSCVKVEVAVLGCPSWAVRPNEPYGFRGRKAVFNHAHAMVSACP